NTTSTRDTYPLSLHDALPISRGTLTMGHARAIVGLKDHDLMKEVAAETIKNEWSVRELEDYIQKLEQPEKKTKASKPAKTDPFIDRKSTRLNSSHVKISYAVF